MRIFWVIPNRILHETCVKISYVVFRIFLKNEQALREHYRKYVTAQREFIFLGADFRGFARISKLFFSASISVSIWEMLCKQLARA
ncbi:MAG: hypothetical protein B6D41_10915 [Chloroflexi bacterium UTCFX4]|nr:MAG: hypothetical protein B6D41_10915 [Chloroflexi bacterium UTCFX4]